MSQHEQLALGLIGVILVVTALAWRAMSRWEARAMIRGALEDPDPQERCAALRLVGEGGLSRYIGLLTELADREVDNEVRAVLRQIVSRNQWEPADDPRLIALRLELLNRDAEVAGPAGRSELHAPVRSAEEEVTEAVARLFAGEIVEDIVVSLGRGTPVPAGPAPPSPGGTMEARA